MSTICLIIVDDHPAVRFGLQAILNKFDDLNVIGVAENGPKALDLCRRQIPDVALIDLFMPGMDGIKTTAAIRSTYPTVQTVMLTQQDSDEAIKAALDAGAAGYMVKSADIDAIADAIRAAAAGRRTLSPDALESLIRAQTAPPLAPDTQLTNREAEVLRLMARGLKNPQIAAQMYLSVSTVKFHISTIFKKLDVRTRTEAVVKALDSGLVTRDDNPPG